jgi:hypothetical protein
MLEALKALLSSKKFLTAVFTVLANLALKFGLELDVDQAVALTSPLIAAIFGQTVIDVKKAGNGASTAVTLVFAFITAGVVGLAVTSSGCTKAQLKDAGVRAATSMVDCMQPTIVKTALELKPTYRELLELATGGDGKVDREALKAAAAGLKTPALRCAFSTVVAEAMHAVTNAAGGVQSAPLEVDKEDLAATFEAIRAESFAGERYKLESGVL